MSAATSRPATRLLRALVGVSAYWAAFCSTELAIDAATFWLGVLPRKLAQPGWIVLFAGLVFGTAAYLFAGKVAAASSSKKLLTYIAIALLVAGVSKGTRNLFAANDAFPRTGIMRSDGTCAPF